MDKNSNNRTTKQARELQNMVIQLIELWLPILDDELYGQRSALRSRAMKLMGLWIEKLELESEEDRLKKDSAEWERENEMLTKEYGEEEFNYEFKWEHI